MTPPSRWEREASKVTSEVARRAIRRLDLLEWLILAMTAALAVGGGGLVALLVVGRTAPGFRGTWIVTSLLLLIVPGALTLLWDKRNERRRKAKEPETDADG